MIVTVTLNPAIDMAYPLETLSLNEVNRVKNVYKTAGGKGLNVTRVLHQLRERVVATGCLGGSNGAWIEAQLDRIGICHDFYRISGETRSCLALLHDQQQTEILEVGPTLTTTEQQQFLSHFDNVAGRASVVVLSGSLPQGVSPAFYVSFIKKCQESNTSVILDCAGDVLREVLQTGVRPTMIKPNLSELRQLVKQDGVLDEPNLKQCLQKDCFVGIDTVFVSLGAQGAFVKRNDRYYRVHIPRISVVNAVGSGDAVVAGLASALLHQESDEVLVKKAITLGMLNAQEQQTGYVNIKRYDDLFKQIELVEV